VKKLIPLAPCCAFALFTVLGCSGRTPRLDDKVLVDHIFDVTMLTYSISSMYPDTTSPRACWRDSWETDHYVSDLQGGYCHVQGPIEMNVTVDQQGKVTSGTAQFSWTYTWVDYPIVDTLTGTWTLDGAPSVSVAGLFTLQPHNTFGAPTGITVSGGVREIGPNGYTHTADVQQTINVNSDGRGGDASGSIDGRKVHIII